MAKSFDPSRIPVQSQHVGVLDNLRSQGLGEVQEDGNWRINDFNNGPVVGVRKELIGGGVEHNYFIAD